MDRFSFNSVLKSDVKINIVIRLLSIPLSILALIVFSDSLHDLVLESLTLDEYVKTSINVLLMGVLFWPFSYVAIKGKSPKHWHPYH
ncbi:hypothetical protein I6F53_02630 [Pseudoalteromonas sp. SWN29]|uniref:hypothetical protein n=1 Tax=Pseudoalteromonas sp. SWN29 TaxID=2792064 RepID=UPI0018CFB2AE|nr:hypothetical protein [Pseudoalteromonas sp. SWN29]MBH0025875.1 hypothetical protein [Pseudoalteromonas sp. SWN29]